MVYAHRSKDAQIMGVHPSALGTESGIDMSFWLCSVFIVSRGGRTSKIEGPQIP